jgi:hypothetical protein
MEPRVSFTEWTDRIAPSARLSLVTLSAICVHVIDEARVQPGKIQREAAIGVLCSIGKAPSSRALIEEPSPIDEDVDLRHGWIWLPSFPRDFGPNISSRASTMVSGVESGRARGEPRFPTRNRSSRTEARAAACWGRLSPREAGAD